MEEKPYKITSVCKDDLRIEFNKDQKALDRIEKLEDWEMNKLANKMEDDYCNQLFWQSLRNIFETMFMEE